MELFGLLGMTNAQCYGYLTLMLIAVHVGAAMIAVVGVDRLLVLRLSFRHGA